MALHTLATTFFPRSYRALDRLGDAQRVAGDSTGALTSYRRALDVNPHLCDVRQAIEELRGKKSGHE